MAVLQLNDGFTTTIDDADLEALHEVGFECGLIWRGCVVQRNWRARPFSHTAYACSQVSGSVELRLHRMILNAQAGQVVDHIDGNGLNNTRANLRITDWKGNGANRRPNAGKQRKGVSFHKQTGKWTAQIKVDGKKRHIGLFLTEAEAQAAYNAAAIEAFCEFAKTC